MELSAIPLATTIVLLTTGVSRVVAPPPARPVGVGLIASSAVVALSGEPLRGLVNSLGVPHLADLVQLLLITTAASAWFTLSRHVALTSALLHWRPVPTGMVIGLLQIVLFASADVPATRTDSGYLLDNSHLAEIAVLWLLTAAWPAVVAVVTLRMLQTYSPASPRPIQIAAYLIMSGLLFLAVATALLATEAVLRAPTAGTRHTVTDGTATILTCGGLVTIAIASILPRMVLLTAPVRRWIRETRALWLVDALVMALGEAETKWTPPWSSRTRWRCQKNPHDDLFRAVIFIRDASGSLLARVDQNVIEAAFRYAQRRSPAGDESALAEACWLYYAIQQRGPVANRAHEQSVVVLDRDPDESPGSFADEVQVLSAVATMWKRRRLLEGFMAEFGPRTRPK